MKIGATPADKYFLIISQAGIGSTSASGDTTITLANWSLTKQDFTGGYKAETTFSDMEEIHDLENMEDVKL